MSIALKGCQFGVHSRLISRFVSTEDVEILNGDIAEKLLKAHDEAAKKFIIYSTRAVTRPDVLDAAKHYLSMMNLLGSVINCLPSRDQPGAEDITRGEDTIILPPSELELKNP